MRTPVFMLYGYTIKIPETMNAFCNNLLVFSLSFLVVPI